MNKNNYSELIRLLIAPILGVAAFILGLLFSKSQIFALDKEQQVLTPLALAMLITYITNSITSYLENKKYQKEVGNILETVKKYNHVITIGTPVQAIEYVNQRLDLLSSVWNTSINTEEEEKLSQYSLYDAENSKYNLVYNSMLSRLKYKQISWKDISNKISEERLQKINEDILDVNYSRRITKLDQPHMNFMILKYKDSSKNSEVLFNWEHNCYDDPPKVMLSEDLEIVDMYKSHFMKMWDYCK